MIAHSKLSHRKALEGHVGRRVFLSAHGQGRRNGCLTGRRGPETSLLPNPARTFRRNCLLGKLVAELDLELRAVEPLLARKARDVELALLLLGALLGESRFGVDEPELVKRLKLLAKLVECVHREHRCRYGNGIPFTNDLDEVIFENAGLVVEEGVVHPLRHPLRAARRSVQD